MKTIITQNIDNYDIVLGIGSADALIDSVATKKIIDKKIIDDPIFKQIDELKKQMQNYANQAVQAKRSMKFANKQEDKEKFYKEFLGWQKKINELGEQLRPLAIKLEKIYSEMMIENAVYFMPKKGEIIVDDELANEINDLMQTASENNQVVDKDKNLICNYRKKIFWKKNGNKWQKTEIAELGQKPPVGGIENNMLNESQKTEIAEQLETERIEGLTSQQKLEEKNQKLDSLLKQAGIYKSELEIQNDSDPLGKSQVWYNAEAQKIEDKYA